MPRDRLFLANPFLVLALLLAVLSTGIQPSQAQAPPTAQKTTTMSIAQSSHNVDFVAHLGGFSWAVAVQGDYAYVGEGPRLTVLNISNPGFPQVVGKTAPLPDIVAGVAVVGSYACIADDYGGLRVVDVSDPARLTQVGFYDTPGQARDVALVGTYAYVADGTSGLRVVDVSDPAHPSEVGFYSTQGTASGVAVAGTYAYVADHRSGLRVVDVSDPAHPIEVGFHDTPGQALDVALAGGYAYVADEDGGLRVVDVSDPAHPSEVGFYARLGWRAYGVAVEGPYAYVAFEAGLQVVDVSDPAHPGEVGFLDTLSAVDVALFEEYAYVADGSGGLRVGDVSDPAHPNEVGFYDTPGSAYGVAVAEGYAYVADGAHGLRVVDVSDPAHPNEVGFYDTPGSAYGVVVMGGYAYVADWNGGLRVVDVSDPAHPIEVGFLDTLTAWDVAVAEGYAYVADGGSGLRVVDVSDPAHSIEVGFYNTLGSVYDVVVAGDYAYVASDNGGLRVVDVSDPAQPSEVGFYDTTGDASGVAAAGGLAYVADGWGGLYILRFTGGFSGVIYDGPTSLPAGEGFIVDEPDNRLSMGDHVHLRLPFRNNTMQTMHNAQVEILGFYQDGSTPGVQIYDGTDWGWFKDITLTPSDIPPGETADADFWIYIGNVEPQFRESLYGQTQIRAYHGDVQTVIPIHLSPISFDIPGNEDMTAGSCLHNPTNFDIQRYAQYAAGASEGAIPPTGAEDPDEPTAALRNLVAVVHKLDDEETDEPRRSDLTLFARWGQSPIGSCRHFADLTTGLVRSLGVPTRYISSMFTRPEWPFVGSHAWVETYLPSDDGWRHVDSLWGRFLEEGYYEHPDVGWTVAVAWADSYPLSSACHLSLPTCRCVHSCYEAPVDCPSCLFWNVASPTPWDTSCVEPVTDEYHSSSLSQLQGLSQNGDALVVQAEASVFVTRTVPFSVTARVRNNTGATLDTVTASVSVSDTVLSSLQLFDPDPLYHALPAIAPGETVTVTWEVMPLVAGSSFPLRLFALSDGHLGFDELPLVVGEPGSLPPLTINGTCNSGQVSPGQSVTLTAPVLDELLQSLDNPAAEVSASVFFSPTTEFSETVALAYDSALQQYRGELDLPIDAPAGRYEVNLHATCPGYSSADSESAFWVAPPLAVGIELSSDTIRPQEILTVTVSVQDRGALVSGAGVWADVVMPGSTVRIPPLPTGEGVYVAAFRPADLSSELGGVWTIEATADYKGSSATAAASVLVLREVYLPLVLRNH
jgi:hypothetical protein